jgi:mercuric ion binding protein
MRSKLLVVVILAFISTGIMAQSKVDSVKIQTSAQCGDCKYRIEEALAFEKGVKESELDLETKIVTVYYKSSKTNADKIKLALTKVGYDADEMLADQKAYQKLPACCKKPDDPKHESHDKDH